jgi:hypothetical protein
VRVAEAADGKTSITVLCFFYYFIAILVLVWGGHICDVNVLCPSFVTSTMLSNCATSP